MSFLSGDNIWMLPAKWDHTCLLHEKALLCLKWSSASGGTGSGSNSLFDPARTTYVENVSALGACVSRIVQKSILFENLLEGWSFWKPARAFQRPHRAHIRTLRHSIEENFQDPSAFSSVPTVREQSGVARASRTASDQSACRPVIRRPAESAALLWFASPPFHFFWWKL